MLDAVIVDEPGEPYRTDGGALEETVKSCTPASIGIESVSGPLVAVTVTVYVPAGVAELSSISSGSCAGFPGDTVTGFVVYVTDRRSQSRWLTK